MLLSAEMHDGFGLLLEHYPQVIHPHEMLSVLIQNTESDAPLGNTLWRCAARGGHVHLLKLLSKLQVEIKPVLYMKVVRSAVKGGHLEGLLWLAKMEGY